MILSTKWQLEVFMLLSSNYDYFLLSINNCGDCFLQTKSNIFQVGSSLNALRNRSKISLTAFARVILFGVGDSYSFTQQQPQYRATQRACAQHYPTSVDPRHLLCFFAIKATRKSARKSPPEPLGVKVIKYNIRIYD